MNETGTMKAMNFTTFHLRCYRPYSGYESDIKLGITEYIQSMPTENRMDSRS